MEICKRVGTGRFEDRIVAMTRVSIIQSETHTEFIYTYAHQNAIHLPIPATLSMVCDPMTSVPPGTLSGR